MSAFTSSPSVPALRTVLVDGRPWFYMSDVEDLPGVSKPRLIYSQLSAEERMLVPELVQELGSKPAQVRLVSLSGLYTILALAPGALEDGSIVSQVRKWIGSVSGPANPTDLTGPAGSLDFSRPVFRVIKGSLTLLGDLRLTAVVLGGISWFVGFQVDYYLKLSKRQLYKENRKRLGRPLHSFEKLLPLWEEIPAENPNKLFFRDLILYPEHTVYGLLYRSGLKVAEQEEIALWLGEGIASLREKSLYCGPVDIGERVRLDKLIFGYEVIHPDSRQPLHNSYLLTEGLK